MQIHTTRFGAVQTETQSQLHFSAGLLGFPDIKDYIMLDPPQQGPFKWLQAIQEPDLAFVIMDPHLIVPDYRVEISADDLRELGVQDVQDLSVYVILTIAQQTHAEGEPYQVTANLQGPVIMSIATGRAKQLVLVRSPYHTRHVLFKSEQGAETAPKSAKRA